MWEKEFYFFQLGNLRKNFKSGQKQRILLAQHRKWPVCYVVDSFWNIMIAQEYGEERMAVRGQGRRLQAHVIVNITVHTLHTSAFNFAMSIATTVLCNSIKDCIKLEIIYINYPRNLNILERKIKEMSRNCVCLQCWELRCQTFLTGIHVMFTVVWPWTSAEGRPPAMGKLPRSAAPRNATHRRDGVRSHQVSLRQRRPRNIQRPDFTTWGISSSAVCSFSW